METMEPVYHEGYEYYKSEGAHIGEIKRIVYKKERWIIETYYEQSFYLQDTLFENVTTLSAQDRYILDVARAYFS
jgi:hypothetical protein